MGVPSNNQFTTPKNQNGTNENYIILPVPKVCNKVEPNKQNYLFKRLQERIFGG
jgi:hypothetical protein